MRTFAVIIAALCFPLLLSAQAVLYAASGNGNLSKLYTVDPLTAQSTLIGDVLVGTTGVTITGLAFQPGTGILFGVTGSETGPERALLTINPATAQAVMIGTVGNTRQQNASDLTFAADGTLFGWTVRGGPLMTIDVLTAVRTAIGSAANGTQGNGLTFTPNGTLYLAGPTGPGSLFTVNPSTGAITNVATLSNVPENFGSSINALTSDDTGLLYATGRSSGAQLVTINPVTGVMTTRGVLGFGEADALAFSLTVVPEPSTWTLLALGLGCVGAAMRRRRA